MGVQSAATSLQSSWFCPRFVTFDSRDARNGLSVLAILKKRCDNLQNQIVKAVRQLSPIHRMAPWLRMYGSYQGRECSTRPCHGSGYAHSALEHSQLTYGDAIGMSGMQLLRCWYCAIPGPCPTPRVVVAYIYI